MHKLDDNTLITPLLLRRFRAEAEFDGADGRYVAFMQKSDGGFLGHSYMCRAGMLERLFAEDMLVALNKHITHDGAWVIIFTHYEQPKPPMAEGVFHRFVLLWMDKDGDVKFPLECPTPLHKVMETATIDNWIDQCEGAWILWRHTEDALDVRQGDQYRRALGEKAPSVH